MNAIINVVTWKDWHNHIFANIGLKNLSDCLDELSDYKIELCIHTDNAEMILEAAKKIGLDKKCLLNITNDFPKSKNLYNEQSHLRGQYSEVSVEEFKKARRNAYERDTEKALKEDAILFFYSSHQYHSKGIFKTCIDKIKEGKSVIFQTSVRVNFENLFYEIQSLKETPSPRELARMIKTHYHNFFFDCDIERYSKREFFTHPYCFTKFLDDGFISHGWQGYILALKPFQKITYVDGQDGTAFPQMFHEFDKDVYALKDSDEGISIDLNKSDRFYPYIPKGANLEEWLFFVINNVGFSNYHRKLSLQSYVCHSEDLTEDVESEKIKLLSLIYPIVQKSIEFRTPSRYIVNEEPSTKARNIIPYRHPLDYLSVFISCGLDWQNFKNKWIKKIEREIVKSRMKKRLIIHANTPLCDRIKSFLQTETKIKNFEIRNDFIRSANHLDIY